MPKHRFSHLVNESKPGPDANSLLDTNDGFEQSLRKRRPWVWWTTLLGPLLFPLAIVALFFLFRGGAQVRRLLAVVLATFFFFGRFAILSGEAEPGNGRFFSAAEMFWIVLCMDMMAAVLATFHMDLLFHFPVVGKRLSDLAEDGKYILASHAWMRRATFAGIVAFVMFPLAATGSLGGSIFARLLGVSRIAALASVAVGSVLGCGVMYFGAGLINRYLDRDNPIVAIGGIALVVGLILFLNHRYRKMKKPPAQPP